MTLRGRLTLGGLIVSFPLIGTAALHWIQPAGPAPSAPEPAVAATALPPVSAGAPPVREAPHAPREILERLPVTREALALPAQQPSPDGGPPAALAPEAPLPEEDAREEAEPEGRLYEIVPVPGASPRSQGPLRVEYTLDAELTRRIFRILDRGRVALGHVVLLDPSSGRVLAYASTDVERFPPTRPYPAASLIKVITAATALEMDAEKANLPCRYRGNPYRLTPSRLDPPRVGNTVSLRRALATSNNQCFAQLAVHAVGSEALVEAIDRFGWLSEPARAHQAGSADPGDERYDLGRLGCGLAGCAITPLHAVQMAATLARGELVAPRWIERVLDVHGQELPLPAVAGPRRVMSPELADELRLMLVDTTVRGTARSAFRRRNGRPLLGELEVAGKTGSLSGTGPKGRYEWFAGVAPAEDPTLAVAVLLVQGDLWWRNASQIAGQVLHAAFCEDGVCRAEAASRWIPALAAAPNGPRTAARR